MLLDNYGAYTARHGHEPNKRSLFKIAEGQDSTISDKRDALYDSIVRRKELEALAKEKE